MPNKMKLLQTPHERKSAILTSIIAVLLLLLLFLLGLTYYDPPVSFGMEVNFGTSTTGSGKSQPVNPIASKPDPIQKEKAVEPQKAPPSPPKAIEKVITQKESTVAIPQKTPKKKPVPTPKKEPSPSTQKQATPEPEKPKIAKTTQQVLQNMFKAPKKEGRSEASEGDDSEMGGDKGKETGNPYANSYYGNEGLGGRGGGYGLNGRSLQSNGKVVQECNQEGTVVVRITVNQKGEVEAAQPGVKGTTNAHPCLLEPARRTALLHRWYPDTNAPTKQIGFVVIQFKLGE